MSILSTDNDGCSETVPFPMAADTQLVIPAVRGQVYAFDTDNRTVLAACESWYSRNHFKCGECGGVGNVHMWKLNLEMTM